MTPDALIQFATRVRTEAVGDALCTVWNPSGMRDLCRTLTALTGAGVPVEVDDDDGCPVSIWDDGDASLSIAVGHNLIAVRIAAWGYSEGQGSCGGLDADVFLDPDDARDYETQTLDAVRAAIAEGRADHAIAREDAYERRREGMMLGEW